MPRHAETRRLPWSPEQLFAIVADVARYPEFLPWVIGTRIQSRSETLLVADLVVGFKMVRERFTSRVTLDRPSQIHVDYVAGPLRYLRNDWRFRPAPGGGTEVDFAVDFEFASKLFETLAGLFFDEALRRMVRAFEKRAEDIYGAAGTPAAETPVIGGQAAT